MLTDGVTVTELPEILPGIQLYVVAPVALNDEVLPAQIVPGVAVDATVGVVPTVTVTVPFAEHPPVVPVTVYVVVAAGETVTLLPVILPGCQVYVVAPLTASVVGLPEQIVVLPVIVSVGEGLTVTATVEVEVHPLVVPVTV